MQVFFDANVLLDNALRREPHLADSLKAFELCRDANIPCWFSWHTLALMAHFLPQHFGSEEATMEYLEHLMEAIQIAPVNHEDAIKAFSHNNHDFEDAMQISSALSCKADIIISRDEKGGFKKSPIKVIHPKEFLETTRKP